MRVLTSRVRGGQLDLPEGALQEGETVTVLIPESDDEGFTVTREERALLVESIEQARRGDTVDGWVLLDEIRH